MLLLAETAGTLAGAEQMAGAIQRLGLYYLTGLSWAVTAAMTAALSISWRTRLKETRELLKQTLNVMQAITAGLASLTRAIEAKVPTIEVPAMQPPGEPPP